MKIGTKMSMGFGSILLLLISISTIAFIAFSTASEGFIEYRNLARDTNLANRLEYNLLMVRMNVKEFLITRSEEDIQEYNKYFDVMEDFLEEAQVEIQKPERAAKIDQFQEEVATYKAGFLEVTDLMAQRNHLVLDILDVKGQEIRSTLSEILLSAEQDGDMVAAFHTSLAVKHLLLGRLYVARFLDTNELDKAERVNEEFDLFESELAYMDRELQNPRRREYLAQVQEAFPIFRQAATDLFQVIADRNVVIDNVLDHLGPIMASGLDSVTLSVNADQDILGPQLQESNQFAVTLVLVVSLFAILAGVGLAIVISMGIIGPLKEAVSLADLISQGDLSSQIEVKTKDEIGQLAQAMGKMLDSLRAKGEVLQLMSEKDFTIEIQKASSRDSLAESLILLQDSLNGILKDVQVASDKVFVGSDQVSSASTSLSQGATENAASLEEISSSLNEVRGQAQQNSHRAKEASGLAEEASKSSEKGNDQMQQLQLAMVEITSSAQEIGKIVRTIDDIAFQINLLALNANVEAARAGKYGRGFAVVAEEVRLLAVRSAEAVQETTVVVEKALKSIKNGDDMTKETAVQLDLITESSKKVASFLGEIASASSNQSISIDQITQGLDQVDTVTQTNTANAEQTASSAVELASQAKMLLNAVSEFKLSEEYRQMPVLLESPNPIQSIEAP